jgi:CRP/FNR family transcriptional regulator
MRGDEHTALITALEEAQWPTRAAVELAGGAHVVPYEKHSTIFHAGEAADLVYVLLSGEAKLQFDAGTGTSLLVSITRGGQTLGVFAPESRPSAGAKPEQFFTAQALSRCKVAIIPTARVAHALNRLPAEQLVRVLERSREQWTQLCCRLLTFLTMSVRRRLTHTIAEIADAFGVAHARGRLITLRLSHEDFAALVGASRPMVSKQLKELASEGVLSKQHGRYVVLLTPQSTPADEQGRNGDGAAMKPSPGRRQLAGLGESRVLGHNGSTGNRERTGQTLRVEEKGSARSI